MVNCYLFLQHNTVYVAKNSKEKCTVKEFEIFLKNAIRQKNEFNSVNVLPIQSNDRAIIDKLKNDGLIENIRYIGMNAVGFDLTYDGLHYFDE